MASINLTKLKPGKTYVVKARAIDADGNYSQYSFGYLFTVPSAKEDGTQLTATNNSVVTALAPNSSSATGGALIAGGLDTNGAAAAGALNLDSVWNNTASAIAKLTGTANTGAVVINSTGILGYQLTSTSSGQANFFLDTLAGNAYFRGTVYAASGVIGGFNIGPTSLYNTASGNTISINAGLTGEYPSFKIVGASSSLTISGDESYPQITMNNNNSTQYSDLLIKAGAIGSPDFSTPSTYNSRGEILFWGANSINPNQITIRRYGESGGTDSDGLAFIDLQTNTVSGTPDVARIGMFAGQSSGINPDDNQKVSIELYKSFGDTSATSYPAYLELKVLEGIANNQIKITANQNTESKIDIGPTNNGVGSRTLNLFTNRASSAGQNTINIGASATEGSTPQVITIGKAIGANNTITIGGSTDTALTLNATASVTGKITAASFVGDTGNFTALTISGSSVATQEYANSASLNAYNSASSYTAASAYNNTSASVRYAASAGYLPVSGLSESTITIGSTAVSLGDNIDNLVGLSGISLMGTVDIEQEYNPPGPGLKIKSHYLNESSNLLELTTFSSPSAPLVYFDNGGNLVSSRTASFSNKVTAASFVGNGSGITLITASNVFGTVGSAASVESTVIGGILNSSSNAFTLLATPLTINAFGGASAITIGYQTNGTSTINLGPTGSTIGNKTLNLFTSIANTGGQNTINIGASGATAGAVTQVINIGKATGANNTITIGGSTDTALTLNATASVTGKITAASFVGNGAGLTNIPTSALSASTITIGLTPIGLGNTSTSLSGLSSISASSASISGTINAASVIATQVTGGGMDLVYSGSFASTSGSVLIDNIFSSNYANYRVTYTTASNAANTSIYFRYANVGVPSSSALYTYATLSNATSTTTANSSSVIYHSVGAYTTGATHVFEFYGPALTTTHMFKTEIYDAYLGGPTQQTVRGTNTNSSSFSGIVLATIVTSANFNGTVRVYGYHN